MSLAITKSIIFKSPSKTTYKNKSGLAKMMMIPYEVNCLADDLTEVKSNQNYTYDIIHKLKDRVGWNLLPSSGVSIQYTIPVYGSNYWIDRY